MSDCVEFMICYRASGREDLFIVQDGTMLQNAVPIEVLDKLLAEGYDGDTVLHHREIFYITGSSQYVPTSNPTPTPTHERYDMSKPVIEQKTLFRGMDVARMDEGELIHTLRSVESEIESLQAIKTESAAIATQIDKLNGALAVIAKALDAKV